MSWADRSADLDPRWLQFRIETQETGRVAETCHSHRKNRDKFNIPFFQGGLE